MDEKEKEELLKKIEEYTKKIEEEPNNASNYYNRGNAFRNLKNYHGAINDYNKAIELNPNNAFYYNNRGISFSNLKKYHEAINDYNKTIELNPNNASYYNNRGISFSNLKKYHEAINDYNRAIELNPNYISVYNSRGLVYNNLGEYKKAIDDFDKTIELDPNYTFAYNNRGVVYNNLKDYKKAISDFDKAIELDPNYTFAYNNRGVAYNNLKDYRKAISDFDKAIKLDPNYTFAYNNRAVVYNNLGKYEEAIDDCNNALKLNPNYISAYNNRAIIYNNLGKYEEAINDCNNALKLDPNNSSVIKLKKNISELKRNKKNKIIQEDNKIDNATKNFKTQKKLKKESNIINFNDTFLSYINTENKENKSTQQDNKTIDSIENLQNLEEINKDDNIDPDFVSDFNNALSSHLNAKCDEDFKIAEEKLSSFINKYKKYKKKSSALENLLEEAELYKKASKEKVKRLVGYLTFADILGWKGIWQKQNNDNGKINNIKKLLSIKNKIDKEFNKYGGNYNLNLISDTFVIYARNFELSNKLSKELIKLCLEKDLLIRGATSYGECYNKDMVYVGQAVDEAASWHEKGEEIVIFYTASAKLNKNLSDNELEKYYLKNNEVNIKGGKIKTYFINWYNETTEKRFYEIMKKEIIYPEISLKYFNTENRLNEILHPEEKEKEEC
ncbi:hypothetical protein CBG50_12030 [Fusobacterium polymorphum]|uniref:Uncharacterized protein n=1 Tax=Fusobacterium nucleatum subsp. polymorphum TaxID=76857 RepID=A0A1Z3CLZ5_FUSNP|nr:tetratricopeptide repeat protein [Fusobacterium polymorphum]ASC03902.1 hypothetical protein CBG50_12030 [Fusobacterium polymorphum]